MHSKDSMISTSTTSPTSPTSPDFALSTEPRATIQHPGGTPDRYRYRVNASGEHEAHPGCPDSLTCLVDTNERPLYTIPVLISCAILGSPDKRMLVSEIYQSIMDKYPYFTSSELIETRFKVRDSLLHTPRLLRSCHTAISPTSTISQPTFRARTGTTTSHARLLLECQSFRASGYETAPQTR